MNENVQKWLDALCGGEFQQTRGLLRSSKGHCCLGVACEVFRRETGQGEWSSPVVLYLPDPEYASEDGYEEYLFTVEDESTNLGLPDPVRKWLGLRSNEGEYTSPARGAGAGALSTLNDRGQSFEQIAAVIASKPRGLFE